MAINDSAAASDDWEAHLGLLTDTETFLSAPDRMRMFFLTFATAYAGAGNPFGPGPRVPAFSLYTSDATGAVSK